ncbi:hypothetical protein IWX91DRAFT_319760 [Phyllosticta citricarpa]
MSRCAGQVVVLRAALCARGPVDLANTGTGHLEAHCGYQRLRNKRTGERDGSDERLSDSSWSTVQCGAVQYSMAMGGLQLLGAGQTGSQCVSRSGFWALESTRRLGRPLKLPRG